MDGCLWVKTSHGFWRFIDRYMGIGRVADTPHHVHLHTFFTASIDSLTSNHIITIIVSLCIGQ
jgi:hypothetical protein